MGPGHLRGALADDGLADDDGGLADDVVGLGQGALDLVGVVAVDLDDVPVVGAEAEGDVVAVGDVVVALDADVVVVVEPDEVVEAQVTGEGGGLMGDAFLQIAVGDNGVDLVVADFKVVRVVNGGVVLLADGEADGVAGARAQGPGGDLDALGVERLGMAGGLAVELAEALDLLHRDGGKSGEVEEAVDEHRAVARGEDEAVAIRPLRIRRVNFEELRPEDGGEFGAAHRQAGVARLRGLDGVEGQDADRVRREGLRVGGLEGGGFGHKSGVVRWMGG